MLRNGDWKIVTDVTSVLSSRVQAVGMLGPLKMKPMGCPETSVPYFQTTLRNIAEDGRRLSHIGYNELLS
jgi:hypothetical protein